MTETMRRVPLGDIGALCPPRRPGLRGHTRLPLCICCIRYLEDLMRDTAVNLRALPEQRDLIVHVLLDQVFFGLSRDKFQEFTALLDAPTQPNPGLARLMAVQAPWSAAKA